MPMPKKWLRINLKEVKSRRVELSKFKCGIVIILTAGAKPQIDLVEVTNTSNYRCIRRDFIDYNKLISAETIEERIQILLDSVRYFEFMFYIDSNLVDVIIRRKK